MCYTCRLKHQQDIYQQKGGKLWRRQNIPKGQCSVCKKEIYLWRDNQLVCKECVNKPTGCMCANNQYKSIRKEDGTFDNEHRVVAEAILKRTLLDKEVIHHIDENPKNNSFNNLLVLSDSDHKKLHKYLQRQRAVLEQSNIGNLENCWNSLRVSYTTAWLETTNVMVLKIWELANQQPSS